MMCLTFGIVVVILGANNIIQGKSVKGSSPESGAGLFLGWK